MKSRNIVKMVACALLVSTGVNAQTIYEAAKFSGSDLNGTARFVGMGGAMGALGAEISTMGVNPAGIGLYRSNDLMTSFGFKNVNANSNYQGNAMNSSKFSGSFDNIGFVYSSKVSNESSLRYINFGFNYKRLKSFDRTFSMGGNLNNLSQTDQMANLTAGCSIDKLKDDLVFQNSSIGWLSSLGWKGALIFPHKTDAEKYVGFPKDNAYCNFYSKESGGINSYDFNVAFNLEDRVYLGFTLGAYDIDYTKYTEYSEAFKGSPFEYKLRSFMATKGAGVDFKTGIIVRPIEESPLRFGASIASPIFYKMTLNSGAILTTNSDINDAGNLINIPSENISTYDKVNGDCITDYQLRTPWKYNLSLGYTIGRSIALGAEYEYQDYSTSKLLSNDGVNMDEENAMMKSMLKGVNTIRLGAEVKLVPEFALRAGYNNSTAAFKNNAFKNLPLNSIRTDTDYANEKTVNNYTVGLGYKNTSFYADIAYQYSAYKEDFRPFDIENLPMTSVDNNKHQVVVTVGVRF